MVIQSHAYNKINIKMTGNLPTSVDNSTRPYLRPVFSQLGNSCGSACGIGNVFTYEINAARSTDASQPQNQIAYLYAYHFLNDGLELSGKYHIFSDSWDIAKENGIPSVTAFGGFENGYPTKWVNGYSIYYNAMQNRIDQYDSIKITGPASLDSIKQWLYDHGDGSAYGGVAIVTGNSWGIATDVIKAGPAIGKQLMIGFGANLETNHAFTIVGYDDSIRYDFNGDGQYTNTIDVTKDNKIDMRDWEIGALHLVNSWGTANFGDKGFIYCPYWALVETPDNGGSISDNHIFFCKVKKNVTVKAALKVQINNAHRDQIALSIGISENIQALSPTKIKTFKKQFTYAGGDFPMGGIKDSNIIEIGLDISDLIDSIGNAQAYKVFLIIDSKSNSGAITYVSLIDYSNGTPREYPSSLTFFPIKLGRSLITTQNVIPTNGIMNKKDNVFQSFHVKNYDGVLEILSPFSGAQKIVIHDLNGKTITSMIVPSSITRIPVRGLTNGYYTLSLEPLDKKGQTRTVPVIINK
jgi:hypothetical protein